MASKYLYIFDPGHGGLVNGKYQTAGKRSPKFPDGRVLFEGVNNRDNVERIMSKFRANGLDCVDIVNSDLDISLGERVRKANSLAKDRKCIYISIHSDAAGDGVRWHSASGISVWTSKGQTKSDIFASIVIDELQSKFLQSIKWRTNMTDGDEDWEENFYVLRETRCPAILCELGFHTNEAETKRMMTTEFKDKVVNALLAAALKWENI
jgi:N-acetylmuramoyl-L-alanine amidase